jgi:hypothetical protein
MLQQLARSLPACLLLLQQLITHGHQLLILSILGCQLGLTLHAHSSTSSSTTVSCRLPALT